ncbi:imidazolonepropionase [Cysteiniphilum halobium]|uniref:imidazolonepropionase n=1 Tax=Cysteiniphilum halobium TaxID=2219059 RepID=UPI000E65A45E|nr:imidazolonepropionase [Cysteiniphilum halobium]
MYDLIIQNARLVTFDQDERILDNAALVINQGKIIDILAKGSALPKARETIDHNGQLVTPGLIDCHTHLVYAGNRADEFEMRLNGVSYEEIAKQGGGIRSTVMATRNASLDALYHSARRRLKQMMQYGTTSCEIKSGYGLDIDTEMKMLKVAQKLDASKGIDIIPTFLGAHALPPEFDDKDQYIDFIIAKMLPVLKKENLAQVVDGFCENIGFSHAQIRRLFTHAKEHGFQLKLHAEQLSDQKGAALAAQFNALSADHLEYLAVEDIAKMRVANTVAVLLPGAYYFLRETKLPPVAELLNNHVKIAIATDANPGSSPFLSLPLMMNMACTLFRMTPYQAFQATTINAAHALGIQDQKGSIEIGKCADLVLWDCEHYNQIIYDATLNYRKTTIKDGELLV